MYCILPYFKILCPWPDDCRKRQKHVAVSKQMLRALGVSQTQRDVLH